MTTIPAQTGRLWIKQGYQYFRKQPAEFSLLFFAYLLAGLLIGMLAQLFADWIPNLGRALAFVFIPLFTLAFMQACRDVDAGLKVRPQLILYGFRSPHVISLLLLGLLYLGAAWLAIGVSTWVDGGTFYRLTMYPVEPAKAPAELPDVSLSMLTTILVFLVQILWLWFAAPLIAWKNMALPKALFYSFFATLKLLRVFVVYGLTWFMVAGLLPGLVAALVLVVTGSQEFVLILILPFSMFSAIVLHCTFYPSYQSVFGQPETVESSTIS